MKGKLIIEFELPTISTVVTVNTIEIAKILIRIIRAVTSILNRKKLIVYSIVFYDDKNNVEK